MESKWYKGRIRSHIFATPTCGNPLQGICSPWLVDLYPGVQNIKQPLLYSLWKQSTWLSHALPNKHFGCIHLCLKCISNVISKLSFMEIMQFPLPSPLTPRDMHMQSTLTFHTTTLVQIPSEDNLTDILTKLLPCVTHQKLIWVLKLEVPCHLGECWSRWLVASLFMHIICLFIPIHSFCPLIYFCYLPVFTSSHHFSL